MLTAGVSGAVWRFWCESKTPSGECALSESSRARSRIDVGPTTLPNYLHAFGTGTFVYSATHMLANGEVDLPHAVHALMGAVGAVVVVVDAQWQLILARWALEREKRLFAKLQHTVNALGGSKDDREEFLKSTSLYPEELLACWERIEPVLAEDKKGKIANEIQERMESCSMAVDPEAVAARTGWGVAPWVDTVPLKTISPESARSRALRLLLRASVRAARK